MSQTQPKKRFFSNRSARNHLFRWAGRIAVALVLIGWLALFASFLLPWQLTFRSIRDTANPNRILASSNELWLVDGQLSFRVRRDLPLPVEVFWFELHHKFEWWYSGWMYTLGVQNRPLSAYWVGVDEGGRIPTGELLFDAIARFSWHSSRESAYRFVQMPFWIILAVPSALCVLHAKRLWRKRAARRRNLCGQCGYSQEGLTSSAPQCPECGGKRLPEALACNHPRIKGNG